MLPSTQYGKNLDSRLIAACHSVKLYIRQLFNKLQKKDIEQKIKDKHWKKEIAQVPDWPRKSSVAVFRPSYWSPRQSLLHVMWPTRGHGQKPDTTMRCSIWNNRVRKILKQNKMPTEL